MEKGKTSYIPFVRINLICSDSSFWEDHNYKEEKKTGSTPIS